MVRVLRGDEPNDPRKSDRVTLPGWSWGRGKVVPTPHRITNVGGMGQGAHDDISAMMEAGRRLLDEAKGN